jgi:hypothetical protein
MISDGENENFSRLKFLDSLLEVLNVLELIKLGVSIRISIQKIVWF